MFTQLISEFVVRSSYEALPSSAVAAAKRGILDCIAVTLAGSREDVSAILSRRVNAMKGSDEATVINGGFKANAYLAAYANGTMAHALDYDDVIHIAPLWMGHPSVVVLPAVLALAEKNHLGGHALILAYCLGVEIYAKVGLLCGDQPYKNGWHNTSFIGTMAAAGAAAKLMNLDESQVRRCFGIAASLAGGLRQNFGTMTKPLHAGTAARNGVEAALLAEAGLTADESIFEAPLGFKNVFTGNRADISRAIPHGGSFISPEEFAARLGNPWNIVTPGLAFKICPSCRATHFGMETALEYRRTHGADTQQLAEIECHVPSHMTSVLFYHDPHKGLEGKFSLEYVLARTLLDGVPKIGDFTDARVNEPAIRELTRKMKWLPFEPVADTFGTPQFIFRLSTGGTFESKVEYPRGEPENPVDDQMLIGKFEDCAEGILSHEARNRVRDGILGLEKLPHLAEMTTLLRGTR